jgi:dipeptidyl aminopeptidase/acylaminoacyl peptidase
MSPRILAAVLVLSAGMAGADEPVVAPPERLVVDGVPPVPAALADTIARYGAYRSAALVDWHPQDRSILISTRFADTPQLHLVSTPGGARRQLTFYGDAVRQARFHPRGADYIIFSKDVGGGEWYQLYRYDLAGGAVTLLTDGRSRNTLGPYANDGDRIAHMSTRRTGRDTDLWVMNPSQPGSDHLLTALSGGGWQALDWSPDDSKILLQEFVSINESYLWLVDTASGVKTALTPREGAGQVFYGEGRFARDGRSIYVTTDKDSEFIRLARVHLDSLRHEVLTAGIAADVDRFDLSHDGRRIALVADENGQSVLYAMTASAPSPQRLPGVPAGVIGALRWHSDGRLLGFSVNNARSPGDVYSYDALDGRVQRWTHSETAVPTEDFPQAQLVKWPSFDARTISGFLYRPPARFAGRRPVLITIHGGPEGESRADFLGRLNYFVNELGIAVIAPNVRGSTGFGRSFSLLDNGFKREDSYKDIDALIDWIGAQGDLDGGRIAVMGGSYGGHMTLAVSTFYSDRIRCSVDIVGMSNLVTFLEHTEEYRRDLRRVEYGDERDPEMRGFLERIAPLNHVDRIRKPMLVIAGKNDPRVPVSESDQIVAALKQAGTPVWYLMARDEGHGFQKKSNQDYQSYAVAEFLESFLLH